MITDVVDASGYRTEVDSVDASEWSGLLDRFQDANIYQTWSYGAIRWGEKNLSHLVLRYYGEVVGIAQLRIMQSRLSRSGIAYLRWGPLCQLRTTEPKAEVFGRMAAALHQEYVQSRRLFLRILPDAFEGSARAKVFQSAFSQFTKRQSNGAILTRTSLVDLAPPLEELRKKLDQKWRNQLNRAEKNGLEIVAGNDVETYRSFLEIYRQMWARKRFKAGVDVEEFGHMQAMLPKGQRMQVLICLQEKKPVAGAVYSAMGNQGIYLLGATSDSGLKAKGAYLLQWTMIKWLKENGFRYYDLGGIDPERNPGVYTFKRGLSGLDVSRIVALDSCGNALSSAYMKSADFVRDSSEFMGKFKASVTRLLSRPKLQPGSENKAG